MQLHSDSLQNKAPIPEEFCFGIKSDTAPMALGKNRSPHLKWSDIPSDAKSFALICVDVDVPSIFDDVNQEGKTLDREMPRMDFYHWVVTDIPAGTTELAAGIASDGITAHGKPAGAVGYGTTGINDYTMFMKGNADMEGNYGGYDGPCPPWNDERLHNYVFTVYALAVETLGLSGNFTGKEALLAMEGQVLGQASLSGSYSLNPNVG